MKPRVRRVTGTLLAVCGLLPAAALAGPEDGRLDSGKEVHDAGQHGGSAGHLPASDANVRKVGALDLFAGGQEQPGRVADVGARGNYAYLGAYNEPDCQTGGIYVVDIRNPASPKKVGFIKSHTDSYVSEGVQALRVETSSFKGDLLAYNNETCIGGQGIGGATLVDVTNPLKPKKLVEGYGDFTQATGSKRKNEKTPSGGSQRKANEIHSVFMWQDAGKAYLVMVDDEEFPDVDILDITNPSRPKLISEMEYVDESFQAGVNGEEVFLHDMVVKEINGQQTMLLSYWDGGYIRVNVDDPANPVYLDDTEFTFPDPFHPAFSPEGNGHQAEFTNENGYFIATDEDFSPYRPGPFRIATGPHAGEYPSVAVSGGASVATLPDKKLNGPTIYGGYGCDASAPIPPRSSSGLETAPGEEAIVVLSRGPTGDPGATEEACFPGEKAANGAAAGYDAVVLVQRHLGSAAADDDPPFCGSGGYPAGAQIVTTCTTHEAFHRMMKSEPAYDLPYQSGTEPAIGTKGEDVEQVANFDGWGYVHLYNNTPFGTRPTEVDVYSIPEGQDEAYASGFGDLSVHEVATDPDTNLAYLSYYSGGFRVLRYGPTGLDEVGHYIAPGGSNFWGVEVHKLGGQKYVLASDRDSGLWVFQYTGG